MLSPFAKITKRTHTQFIDNNKKKNIASNILNLINYQNRLQRESSRATLYKAPTLCNIQIRLFNLFDMALNKVEIIRNRI